MSRKFIILTHTYQILPLKKNKQQKSKSIIRISKVISYTINLLKKTV